MFRAVQLVFSAGLLVLSVVIAKSNEQTSSQVLKKEVLEVVSFGDKLQQAANLKNGQYHHGKIDYQISPPFYNYKYYYNAPYNYQLGTLFPSPNLTYVTGNSEEIPIAAAPAVQYHNGKFDYQIAQPIYQYKYYYNAPFNYQLGPVKSWKQPTYAPLPPVKSWKQPTYAPLPPVKSWKPPTYAPLPPVKSWKPPTYAPLPPVKSLKPPTYAPLPPVKSLKPPTYAPLPPVKSWQPPTYAPLPPVKSWQPPTYAPLPPVKSWQLPTYAPLPPVKSWQPPTYAPLPPVKSWQPPTYAPLPPVKFWKLPTYAPVKPLPTKSWVLPKFVPLKPLHPVNCTTQCPILPTFAPWKPFPSIEFQQPNHSLWNLFSHAGHNQGLSPQRYGIANHVSSGFHDVLALAAGHGTHLKNVGNTRTENNFTLVVIDECQDAGDDIKCHASEVTKTANVTKVVPTHDINFEKEEFDEILTLLFKELLSEKENSSNNVGFNEYKIVHLTGKESPLDKDSGVEGNNLNLAVMNNLSQGEKHSNDNSESN